MLIHINKKVLESNNESKVALCIFLCESQSSNVRLGSFNSLMFCLKLTREVLFFGSSCHICGLLEVIVSSPQYTVFVSWPLRYLKFHIVYGISQRKYFIHISFDIALSFLLAYIYCIFIGIEMFIYCNTR